MTITITITDPTPVQIAAIFDLEEAASNARAAEKTTRTRKPKAEETVAEQTDPVQEEIDAGTDIADEPAEDEAAPTKEDAETAARALVKANGREAMAEMLNKFKATNLSSLKESDYAKFIAACEKATS